MGITLDVISNSKLIDRITIKWLYNIDFLFDDNKRCVKKLSTIVDCCNDKIKNLELNLILLNKILDLKSMNFDETKKHLIILISNTNNDVELDKLISLINDSHDLIREINSDEHMLGSIKNFKIFLEKYENCDYDFYISY